MSHIRYSRIAGKLRNYCCQTAVSLFHDWKFSNKTYYWIFTKRSWLRLRKMANIVA